MSKGKEKARGKLSIGAIPPDLFLPEDPNAKSDQVCVLTFIVGGELLALRVEHTEGVVDCPRITPLPSPPDTIIGVTSVRGRMTLVVDLSMGAGRKAAKRRLILIRGEAQLALLADGVEGVLALSPRKIRPVSSLRRGAINRNSKDGMFRLSTRFFKSGKRQVPIIDIERLAET